MQLGNLILRCLEGVFTVIVIGLSAGLITGKYGQYSGNVPSTTLWSLACGLWGALVAIVGVVSLCIEPLQQLTMVVLDGLAAFFILSGSIAMAVRLGVGSCNGDRPDGYGDGTHVWGAVTDPTPPNPYCVEHDIINGGAITFKDNGKFYWHLNNSWFVARCTMAQANVAFLFFALVAFAISFVLSGMRWRRKGKKLTAV